MAFRPNYNRDRHERDRVARARKDEKQRKKDEKTAQRKEERAAAERPADGQQEPQAEFAESLEANRPGEGAGTVE